LKPAWRAPSTRLALLILLAALVLPGPVQAQSETEPPPSFAELEAAGARIGEIRIRTRDIFDTEDPKEDKLLFRWANALHIQTRTGVIERALLFKTGEPVSVRLIEETERVLRSTRYLYDVQIRPLAHHDGVVDISVETRDTWTLDPGLSAGRSGGANTSGIKLNEYNLLGSGVAISYGRSNGVDRSGNEFQISNERAFGGGTSLGYSRARNSDGQRDAVSVAHPFYALDTPWAAGVSVSRDDRVDSLYNAGNVVSQYRHRQNKADAFGGWSTGRVDGWVQRFSLGVNRQDDAYAIEPGLAAPSQLPSDAKLVAPYFRYELIEDRYETLRNRNQIERPEFFAMGLASTLQLGRASTAWGSSRDAWLYAGTVSRGFAPAPDHSLIGSASISGEFSGGGLRRQRLGGTAQYYLPQSKRWLFYASLSADALKNPDPTDALLLGGDNGMRGYPLRYQSGDRRALLTLEERVYTDLYLLRLFRFGGAVFFDSGRAWGGGNMNAVKPGWLNDAGFGLRIFSVRAAFSNVLHLDVAFPLDPDVNVKRVQFLVKTKTSF
jgi:outer membrane protein assembly factor BamA